ncbi:MAG: hypothetical protein AAFY88_14595, partial [Acidobacteriota bacterium]
LVERFARPTKRFAPCRVAELAVHPLQVIDVDEHQGHVPVCATCLAHGTSELAVELANVAEAGERIVVLRDGRPVAALVGLEDVRDDDQQSKLAELQAQGLVTGPSKEGGLGARKPLVPHRGRFASKMVIEDRR